MYLKGQTVDLYFSEVICLFQIRWLRVTQIRRLRLLLGLFSLTFRLKICNRTNIPLTLQTQFAALLLKFSRFIFTLLALRNRINASKGVIRHSLLTSEECLWMRARARMAENMHQVTIYIGHEREPFVAIRINDDQ